MEDIWRINAFAPFVYGSLYVAASTKKLRLGTYDPPQYKARSQVLADEILDLVVNEGKEEIIVIGRSESRGKIRAFRIPIDNVMVLIVLVGAWILALMGTTALPTVVVPSRMRIQRHRVC